jgi:hypothetical protein
MLQTIIDKFVNKFFDISSQNKPSNVKKESFKRKLEILRYLLFIRFHPIIEN